MSGFATCRILNDALVNKCSKLRGLVRDHGRGIVPEEHVEHDGVDHFMLDDVVEVRVASFERKHDAVLEDFRETADAFMERQADDVGLLELGMGIVQDDRNPGAQLVPHRGGNALVHDFHIARGEAGDQIGALGKVDVEMFSAVIRPFELVVLHLVLPEGLSVSSVGRTQNQSAQ